MGKLIWLASYPKSGNTWLRAFLHNYLRDAGAPHSINRLLDLTATENDAGHYKSYDPRPASAYSIADVQRMRPLVHAQLMEAFPDLVFVKTHNARIEVAGQPLITPAATAGAIYLVRDPRDAAISYSEHLGLPIDAVIAMMADERATAGGDDSQVFERLGSWSGHVASWTRPAGQPLLVLRYEDLYESPVPSFERVTRFLGAADDPIRLEKAIRFSGFDELTAQEASTGFLERPAAAARFFRHGRPGEWRRILSAPQTLRIDRAHAGMMAAFGYR